MNTLSLIVPCKDEYSRLHPTAFLSAVETYPYLTFIFVDDGSTDRTAETLAFLERESPAIHTLYLPRNIGKAEAVRTGVNWALEHTAADAFGFWDADLATPLNAIPDFKAVMDGNPDIQAVLGSRWPHLGVRIERTRFRALTAGAMKILIRLVLGVSVYDTQCGAKVFTRELAKRIFAAKFISRWLFDVELLKRMNRFDLAHRVFELPLREWTDVPGSRLRPADAFGIASDLLRIANMV